MLAGVSIASRIGIALGTLGILKLKFTADFAAVAYAVDPFQLPEIRKNRQASREVVEIVNLFYDWYRLVEPELQSGSELGAIGYVRSGRTLSCGGHASEIYKYIQMMRTIDFELFEFIAYDEYYWNNSTFGQGVSHTYLTAQWQEVGINLDSWKYGFFAPRIAFGGPSEGSGISTVTDTNYQQGQYQSPHGRKACNVPGM